MGMHQSIHWIPKRFALLLGAMIALLLVAGCSPVARRVQADRSNKIGLSGGETLGQTLVSRNAGLAGIRLYLAPETPGTGDLLIKVYPAPGSDQVLASSQVPISEVKNPSYYSFDFTVLNNSNLQDYYVQLTINGDGAVEVGSGEAASYLDGSLYIDGKPASGQLAFQLLYSTVPMAVGVAKLFGEWILWLMAAVFLFAIPGLALLDLLWPNAASLTFGEKLAFSGGISLAIYPILFLLTFLVHLHVGIAIAFLPGILGIIYLVWRLRFIHLFSVGESGQKTDTLAAGAYGIAALILVFTRLWVIRTLDVPMWGDGMQHTMIAQLIVDNQGLFSSWQPYAALTSLTYHFGFHTDTAVLHWISGLDVPHATLLAGQLVNILAVLSLYPLALKLSRGSRWAGLSAVVIGGFVSFMPMYYTNWGRYTQLCGQAILPAVILLFWKLADDPSARKRISILAGIAIGGLALTHYRVFILALLALPVLLLFYLRRTNARQVLTNFALAGIVGGLIFLPWFLHVYGGGIFNNLVTQLSTPAQAISETTSEYNSIQALDTYLPTLVWILSALSLLWGFWRRQKEVAIFALWWLLILLAANPGWLHLSGSGTLSNFAIFIAMYIFAGVVIGAAIGWLSEEGRFKSFRWSNALVAVALLASSIYFGRQRLSDILPAQFSLAASPDVRAEQWIQENIPENATFLVNSFFAYGGSVIVGSDGGWWLPLLAHRAVTTPPLNYGTEAGPTPDYIKQVNALWSTIQQDGVTSQGAIAALEKHGVQYVYIGQQNGRVNYTGPVVLDPEAMIASGHFKTVYHQDRVWILELDTN
jgi:hypothetical protein